MQTGLLIKWKKIGIRGKMFLITKAFLQNREKAINVEDEISEYQKLENGVPQGSVIFPLLYIIVAADLAKKLKQT